MVSSSLAINDCPAAAETGLHGQGCESASIRRDCVAIGVCLGVRDAAARPHAANPSGGRQALRRRGPSSEWRTSRRVPQGRAPYDKGQAGKASGEQACGSWHLLQRTVQVHSEPLPRPNPSTDFGKLRCSRVPKFAPGAFRTDPKADSQIIPAVEGVVAGGDRRADGGLGKRAWWRSSFQSLVPRGRRRRTAGGRQQAATPMAVPEAQGEVGGIRALRGLEVVAGATVWNACRCGSAASRERRLDLE